MPTPPVTGWVALVILAFFVLYGYGMFLRHVERMQIRRERGDAEQREQERINLELKEVAFQTALAYANLYTKLLNEGLWTRDTAPPFSVIFRPYDWYHIHATPDVELVEWE